jgi:hypothetical protein
MLPFRTSRFAFDLPRLCLCAVLSVATGSLAAQSTPGTPQASSQPNPGQDKPAPKGQVLFEGHQPVVLTQDEPATPEAPAKAGVSSSQHRPAGLRRRDANGDPVADTAPATVVETPSEMSSSSAEDGAPEVVVVTAQDNQAAARVSAVERTAVTVTDTSLDFHLNSHTGALEARAEMTVRNGATEPLRQVVLRVSGALQWQGVHLAGGAEALPLEQHRLPDDLDHTGVATEIAVMLPQPLAPGAEVKLDLFYAGTLAANAQRLLAIGAPAGRAALTDWDTVSDTFTGLRGVGNVLWYPVAEPPALLRDGDAVPKAVERARAENAGSRFRLRLTVEYTGARPEAAYFCGDRQVLKPLMDPTAEGGVAVAEWDRPVLGGHTPSLFVAQAAPQEVAGGLVRVVTDRADAARAIGEAAGRIRPMLVEWLGASQQRPLDVIDLAIPGAAGFADGSLLVAPLTTGPAASLAPSLVGPLAASWMPSDVAAPWLRDGLPAFLQMVWLERTEGRAAALGSLAASRGMFWAESAPKVSSSADADVPTVTTPLAQCGDPACSRVKAAYVLEMLRGMLGDSSMQQALSGWRVAVAQSPQRTPATETALLEGLLQQVAGKHDLKWFFGNWIDADKGLPELTIVTVAPRKVERNVPINYLPPKQIVGGPIGAEPVPKAGDPESAPPKTVASGDRIAPTVGSWLVAVEVQNAGGADAEVPVTVRSGGLTNTLPLLVPAHGRATIRVPFEADPEEVQVNDGSVPEVRTSTHRRSLGAVVR